MAKHTIKYKTRKESPEDIQAREETQEEHILDTDIEHILDSPPETDEEH